MSKVHVLIEADDFANLDSILSVKRIDPFEDAAAKRLRAVIRDHRSVDVNGVHSVHTRNCGCYDGNLFAEPITIHDIEKGVSKCIDCGLDIYLCETPIDDIWVHKDYELVFCVKSWLR